MKNHLDIKKALEMLALVLRCPICGSHYGKKSTQIIDSEQDSSFNEAYILLHSDCHKCKSSIVFSVEIRGPEVYSIGMVTDLTQPDAAKFRKFEPIAPGEIINIHKGLKKFNGNFVEALKKS